MYEIYTDYPRWTACHDSQRAAGRTISHSAKNSALSADQKACYPQKTILFGNGELVEELYQDQHLIIVNKPEGMKTHANEPTELALLNHVSAYVGETCYVVHRLDKETSGAVLFAKNPFVLPSWKSEKSAANIGLWSKASSQLKILSIKTRLAATAMIAGNGWLTPEKDSMQRPM